MKKEIILTPEELYYMGALLQAKYIDYAYVAAMGDIQQRREIYESESREGLAKKGILMEDFSGSLEVEAEAKKILQPVFFGTLESSVDVAALAEGEEPDTKGRRFHFYEGRITATEMEAGEIRLEVCDEGKLQQWIHALLPEDYEDRMETLSVRELNQNSISRMIVVKSTRVGKRAAVEIYAEAKGRIFCEKPGNVAETLTREQFCLEIYRGLRGE